MTAESSPVSCRAHASSRSADSRVCKRLHGREMEIRLGQRLDSGRSAEPRHTLTSLDPADLIPEFAGDPDIMILALRHVQDVGLLVAERRLATLVVGEELRIGLGDTGFV